MTAQEIEQTWINEQGTSNVGVTVEMVEGWFTEVVNELKVIGLDKSLGGEESEGFIGMVKTGVIGKIQANITVEPTDFKFMILGPYPERFINKKKSVEMVAIATMDDNEGQMSSISAWRDFVPIKNEIEPLGAYQTGVSFFKEDRAKEGDRFKLTVQGATTLSDETKVEYMGASYDERLAYLRSVIPSVNLGDIGNSLSKLRKSANDKTFADSLDLKKVTVMVVGTADGVDKNRREWAMFHVVDGTFKPTVKIKFIAVWVDPSIYNRLQAGEGSYLEIYGMVQKDNNGQTSMNACFVHPLAVKPMERKENQAQTDQQPGGAVQTPDEPQIKVMTSQDGM